MVREMRRVYGQFLEAKGDQSAAVAEYEKLVAANQADPVALNNLAWQYAIAGNSEAVALAKKAHELAPESGSITDTYGWILYLQGEFDTALPLIEEASKQSPRNLEVQYHLAAVHSKVGNVAEANAIITSLLETDRSFPSRGKAEQLARSL